MIKKISQKLYRKVKHRSLRFYKVISGIFAYNLLSRFQTLPPKEMIINLTYWCNSRCVMCNIWKMKPKNEMTFPEWQTIMRDPIFHTITSLTISGGEASLHPQLIKLTNLFIKSMPKLQSINLITNGFMPKFILKKTEELLKLCQTNHISFSISVSLDGIGKQHEAIRRIPNAFQKTTKTIKLLKTLQKKYDFNLGVGSLLLHQNIKYYPQVRDWAKKNKVNINFQLVGFHRTFVNNLESQKTLDFNSSTNSQLSNVLSELSRPTSLTDFRSYYWRDMISFYQGKPRTTPCPFQKDQFVLDSFGDVYYCLSEPSIGNARSNVQTVSQIYYSKKNLEHRKNMTSNQCLRCNSGCNVNYAIAKDIKHYLWFLVTGRPLYLPRK